MVVNRPLYRRQRMAGHSGYQREVLLYNVENVNVEEQRMFYIFTWSVRQEQAVAGTP